jgi:hypothetical protein
MTVAHSKKNKIPANAEKIFDEFINGVVINFFSQPQVLPPAPKMNNGKQYEKAPPVPKQPGEHHHSKNHCGECPGLKCFPVERHETV